MTIKELMDVLRKCNPEQEVVIEDPNGFILDIRDTDNQYQHEDDGECYFALLSSKRLSI